MQYNKHRIVIMQFEINVKISIKQTHTMKCLPSQKKMFEKYWTNLTEV